LELTVPQNPSNPNAGPPRTPESGLDDLDLLSQIATGDQNAMSVFFDRYSGMVYSVALRVLRDAGEAEDVMQEIFIQIWQNPQSYVAGRGSLGGWLVVTARNRSIDKLRRRKPTDPVELFTLPSPLNLAQESERNLLIEKIQNAMTRLRAEQRSSLQLAFFEDLTHSEIAEKTGDPLGTIKTRIRLALIAIRKELNV
jgi:RNA polymerase sigma-70 factor (ECF subfamily)